MQQKDAIHISALPNQYISYRELFCHVFYTILLINYMLISE